MCVILVATVLAVRILALVIVTGLFITLWWATERGRAFWGLGPVVMEPSGFVTSTVSDDPGSANALAFVFLGFSAIILVLVLSVLSELRRIVCQHHPMDGDDERQALLPK